MTNGEKYKTAQERVEGMNKWCDERWCENCALHEHGVKSIECAFHWLELEEEKPLPCPFCGGDVVHEPYNLGEVCQCKCGYRSPNKRTWYEATSAHNRVAKAVMESEAAK